MAVCSFAHCEAALSLQPVEDTLMVLRLGPKVVFQYELRFVNRLKSQLLISHLFLLFLPIKKMPPGKREETRNQVAFWKYPHLFELSDQFLFQCEKPSAHDRGGFLGRVLIKRILKSVIALPLTHSGPQPQRQHHGRACISASFSSTPEYIPLDFHSVSPALRAGRMDRPGRPEGDNDIVEQYNNPSKELSLPRAL